MAVLDGAVRKLEAILANSPTGPIPRAAVVERGVFRRHRTSQGSFEKKADRLMRIWTENGLRCRARKEDG